MAQLSAADSADRLEFVGAVAASGHRQTIEDEAPADIYIVLAYARLPPVLGV
eukprot:COSAG03_NODE_20567_length_317_cov_0.706422_1_plen_51_part_10